MSWNERIKSAREAQKLTREQTVRKMRAYLPEGKTAAARTLVAWEQGDSEPKVTQAIALARALGYHEVSELFSQADGPQLNRLGMDRLEEYRRLLLQSDEFREKPAVHRLRSLPVYLQPASAGTGLFLDSDQYEEFEVGNDVPATADFGIRVSGDSMEPVYVNKQIVWVHQQDQLENGDIGIFYLNGDAYIKKYQKNKDNVQLISLNKKYAPIQIKPEMELRTFGKVVK